MNKNLVKRLAISSFAGGIFAYLIINPIFMVLDEELSKSGFSIMDTILLSFTAIHLRTVSIIILLGLIIGFLLGLYSHRVNFFYKKVSFLSITDELTQIYNRRHFINELEKEIERSKRFSTALSLIILDIDKFKYCNDTYGHIFGDKIIQSMAKFLSDTIRKIDFVARYGGDEFVIFMPETEKSRASVLAERLQKELSQYSFENHELPIKIKNSISIGIASFPNDAKNIDELIHNADIALYQAKKEGGNRICNFNIQHKTKEKIKLETLGYE